MQEILSRNAGESELSYHKRLIDGKLNDKTLADTDYAELAELVYGKKYASDVARRMMYGSNYTLKLLGDSIEKNISSADVLAELESKKIELAKERQKFFDQRNAFTKLIRERSRQEELNELITSAISDGDLPSFDFSQEQKSFFTSDNDIVVSLHDLHYGAVVSNYWTEYNPDICLDMMSKYLHEIIEIGELHKSENCYVLCNGDCISGNIHYSISVTNKENVIQQVIGASELISNFLVELNNHFSKVIFVSVAGNHSRINPNKDGCLYDERLDDLIEWYIAARLQNYDDIIIGGCDKIDETMYLVDIRGNTYCGVHGDYDGSPAKVQAIQTMVGKPLCGIFSGHLHHNRVEVVQGIKSVMAGSFLGMDDFCVQKRIFGKPEQMVCICDESGIKCYYDIAL